MVNIKVLGNVKTDHEFGLTMGWSSITSRLFWPEDSLSKKSFRQPKPCAGLKDQLVPTMGLEHNPKLARLCHFATLSAPSQKHEHLAENRAPAWAFSPGGSFLAGRPPQHI
jgi:hypothetical protein